MWYNNHSTMTQTTTLTVTPRTLVGKKVRALRSQKIVPANISTPDGKSVAIQLPQNVFVRTHAAVGDTGLVYLTVDGEQEARPVLIEDVQLHSLKDVVLHVVFKQVNLKEKIEAEIPVRTIGENKIPNTVVITVQDSIMVEALPTDFPESFEVDISGLTEIGQMITIKDLPFDRSKITLKVSEEELDTPVVMLQEVKEEPVEEVPVAEPAEGEAAAPTEAAPAEPAADKS